MFQLICDSHSFECIIDTVEMLLLLLWRHIGHYSESDSQNPKTLGLGASSLGGSAMRFLAAPKPENLRLEVGKKLQPSLERLQVLVVVSLPSDILCDDWPLSFRTIGRRIPRRRMASQPGLCRDYVPQDTR